jgi:superfamily I DNA/RNA helicase
MMIKSLTKAVPVNGSITFFGDVAQQIYGHRFSWRSAGLDIARPWLLEENYRNTKQIADFALAITRMPFYHGIPDIVAPKSPAASGPRPALVGFRRLEEELAFVREQAIAQSKIGSVAILVRNHEEKRRFSKLFSSDKIKDLNDGTEAWQAGSRLHIGTYHSSKGVEFDAVILPGLDAKAFPEPEMVLARGQDYAEQTAGRLLYVGVTRAKSTLIMTHSSTATGLLPTSPTVIQLIHR